MKYSYTFVFVLVIFYHFLLILAANDQRSAEEHLNGRKTSNLSRNKRQIYGTGAHLKRNDNYESEEVDEHEVKGNQKKNKPFVGNLAFKPWGGKRSSAASKSQNAYPTETADDLPLAIKRVKTEKTFRSWGGKRSRGMNYNSQDELDAKMLNDYLKRLEALRMLASEFFDSQNDE